MNILVIASIFIPLIISLVLFNSYVTNSVYSRMRLNASNSFTQLYEVLNNNFETIRRDMLPIQISAESQKLLQQGLSNDPALSRLKTKTQVNTIVQYIESANIWKLKLMVYVNEMNDFILDDFTFFPISSIKDEAWYTRLTSSPYKNMWRYDDSTISYSVRVCDPAKLNRTTSVMNVSFDIKLLNETLTTSLPEVDGACVVVADESNIITHVQTATDCVDCTNLLQAIPVRKFSSTTASVPFINNTRYYVQSRSFEKNPWRLIMLVPYDGTTLLSDRQWYVIVISMLSCGFFIFYMSLRFSRRVSRRISLVSEYMSSLKNGVLEPLPQVVEGDEVGNLFESYNYLTEELSMLTTARNLAMQTANKAEIKALQSQINPHFLYNTLEMINYYAYESKPEEVERIVSLLARFYKLCLNVGRELSDLGREIELTETYQSIQNIRYRGAITLKWDIPTELYQHTVPHLILQPIVENAIKHGILKRDDQTGVIHIRAHRLEEDLLIEISDDGAGMTDESLRRISAGLHLANDMSVDGSHYGLKNIHERLIAYYGDGYGLSFTSQPGLGTTVTIRLKVREPETTR
jgi:two-component system sensor histidine kinase YesM